MPPDRQRGVCEHSAGVRMSAGFLTIGVAMQCIILKLYKP
jgi:hypothetical protein